MLTNIIIKVLVFKSLIGSVFWSLFVTLIVTLKPLVSALHSSFQLMNDIMSTINRNKDLINELPNELLVNIFDYLDLKSKFRAQLVSNRWKQLIDVNFGTTTSLLIENIETKFHRKYGDYRPFGIKDSKRFSAIYLNERKTKQKYWWMKRKCTFRSTVTSIISRFTNLKVLYLCFSKCPVKSDLLEMVSKNISQHLIQFTLICDDSNIVVKTDEVLEFCDKFPNIKTFQIEAYRLLITEKSISVIISKLGNLEVLILMSCLSNSKRKSRVQNYKGYCLENLNPSIRMIRLPGFLLNDSGLQLMANKGLKCLQQLRIFDLNGLNSMSIIANNFTSIRSLSCSSFGAINSELEADLFFRHISSLEHLQELHLLVDTFETVIDYDTIKHLKNCRELESLHIESTGLKSLAMEAISQFVPKLTKLKLIFVRIDCHPNDCIPFIQSLKYLKHLSICFQPELTDESMIDLVKSCQSLNYLNILFCESLTVATLSSLVDLVKANPHKLLTVAFPYHIIQQMDFENIPNNLIVKTKTRFY